MVGKLIIHCFHARTAAHVLHLQTRSYAEHKALNEFYDEIVPLADSFAEAYQGEYGMIKDLHEAYRPPSNALELLDDLRECVDECAGELHKDDTHLHNLLDEIRSLIASTQYKLRFLK